MPCGILAQGRYKTIEKHMWKPRFCMIGLMPLLILQTKRASVKQIQDVSTIGVNGIHYDLKLNGLKARWISCFGTI